VIYAVWAKGTDLFKLGYTAEVTPNGRMNDIQVGCPYELELLVFAIGTKDDERQFHAMLKSAKCHVRGEWFKWGQTAHRIVQTLKAQPKPALTYKPRNAHRRLGAALSVDVH
jgi:hypothetical protein